jgi:hypothetical protein
MLTEQTFMSFVKWANTCRQLGIDWTVETMTNESLISRARNTLTAKFLHTEGSTHLMFIDADIGWEPWHLLALLNADKDVIGGLYPMKSLPVKWCVNGIPGQVEDPESNLIEVTKTGTGFLLIKRSVFEKLNAHPAVKPFVNDLGLPKDFPGWVGFKTDAQGHVRAVASACTADQFFKLELIATTAALQAKERQGRDGKYNLVDLTEITFDHFKQMAATAFNKLLGRGSKQDDGYAEIIAVLKKYRPLLFKDMTDAVIAEGLKAKETSITGGPGPTLSLRDMVKRIAKTQAFVSQPVVGGAQPNPLINPETKIKETQDVAWEIAEAVQDLLPEAAGKLIGWVGFFKEAKEHMETVRDAMLLPAGAEDVYSRYKAGRGPAVDQDSTSAYDQAVSGRFAQMIRSAPEFKNMSNEKFTQVFRQRLEARYQMEQMELARAQMAADPEQLIQKIVGSYDSKINSVHRACEEIAASKR